METLPNTKRMRAFWLKAFWDWTLAVGARPFIVVTPTPACDLPNDLMQMAKVHFDLSPMACRDLTVDNKFLIFHARFNQIGYLVKIELDAIPVIYSPDTGSYAPLEFMPDAGTTADGHEFVSGGHGTAADKNPSTKRPTLSLVGGRDNVEEPSEESLLALDDVPPRPPLGRPDLRVVK